MKKHIATYIAVFVIVVIAVAQSVEARQNKVAVCHKPDGANPHTIVIAEPSVPAHLAHGDYLGECRDDTEDVPTPVPTVVPTTVPPTPVPTTVPPTPVPTIVPTSVPPQPTPVDQDPPVVPQPLPPPDQPIPPVQVVPSVVAQPQAVLGAATCPTYGGCCPSQGVLDGYYEALTDLVREYATQLRDGNPNLPSIQFPEG